MYELKNGKLVATVEKPYESAGNIYFYKAPDATTKIVIFERFNKKKNKAEFELGTFGKSDFGIINDKDESSKDRLFEKLKVSGQELPLETALREGSEETNSVITTLPAKLKSHDIVTKAHKCWCDTERELQTIISVLPYKLTDEQYHLLTSKKDYTLFTSVHVADLQQGKDGTFKLMSGSTDLLTKESLKEKWRIFTKILLSDPACNSVMQQVFTKMLKTPVHTLSSNPLSQWYTPAKKPIASAAVTGEEERPVICISYDR